ncbi:MAG: hypothetical protein Q4C98_11600 [Capnocytophaga sp.]|nr:hypothetical protein [Capnocytophaga sp.]
MLYKEEKKDYYIFQFSGRLIAEKIREDILFKNSTFYNPQTNTNVCISSKDEFIKEKKRILNETNDYDKGIKVKKLTLRDNFDFFPMQSFFTDNLVSEILKQSIEENGITGFEFSDLDYEVVVDNN